MTTDLREDPFDARPILKFTPTRTEMTTWGLLASLGILIVCALFAAAVVAAARLHGLDAGGLAMAGAFAGVLVVHALGNPPSGLAVDLQTRRYHLVRGSGRFRRSYRGMLSDIRGVACVTDESSHAVSGYRVVVLFHALGLRCVVETHGPGAKAVAIERAGKLAQILGVGVVER